MSLAEDSRPKTLADCVGSPARQIELLLKDRKDCPNLLLTGPPGCGKTTIAHAVANQLFVTDEMKRANFKEFNASADRGIEVVRSDILSYARLVAFGGATKKI